jgi:formylglycine-generating enzyme required for sulfatase activity/outer membrane protein assembly factor BamD (BamD/ComL family)
MKLFIGYARVDKPLCKQIAYHLEQAHEVWYDDRLHAGQDWWETIQQKIDWCDGFVFLLSPESVASVYCQQELALAIEARKEIFPVLIRAGTPLPEVLSHIQYTDLSQDMQDLVTLLNALTIAERRQLAIPATSTATINRNEYPPHDISPNEALVQAADALDVENYDAAVFVLKQAMAQYPTGRVARLLQSMLAEAEQALEYQAYLRTAAREYEPIRELVKRRATRTLGCQEFQRFVKDFPDYDPDGIRDICNGRKDPKLSTAEMQMIEPPTFTSAGNGNHDTVVPPIKPVYNVNDVSELTTDLPVALPGPFVWVDVPAGKVRLLPVNWANNDRKKGYLHEPQTMSVAPFTISKYPITNAQFERFMGEGGYEQRRFWTAAGWHKRTEKGWQAPSLWDNSEKREPHHPVISVSWYEALAFCAWLSEITGERILLPTEQQWQLAAQGHDDRLYPWGNEWDARRCNTRESNQRGTSVVWQYEGLGESPFGVLDLAGNVWEWCLTDYETGETITNGQQLNFRVLRGGAWHLNRDTAQTTFRFGGYPYFRSFSSLGFRVVRIG